MPLTPYLSWNTSSIPVGATKKANTVKIGARTHASHTLSFLEHEFDSRRRYKLKVTEYKGNKIWRFRLVARTHASHAWNTGSIPVGATSVRTQSSSIFFAYRSRKSTSLFCIRKKYRSKFRFSCSFVTIFTENQENVCKSCRHPPKKNNSKVCH